MGKVKTKRIYEPASDDDGIRILVDRLWPRGLAPFPYSSDSSVKGRTKVSKMGDMKLKVLLNLSAWNAIRSISAFKDYFKRKVSEGKHKMSVRNELLALAVIKRNSPFVKDYSSNLLVLP